MKYEQIDVALSFLGIYDTIIIQYEFRRDMELIRRYILDKIDPDGTITTCYDTTIEILGGARIILHHIDSIQNGYGDAIPFFIERLCDNYSEGDIVGSNIRTDIKLRHEVQILECPAPVYGHTLTSTSISRNDQLLPYDIIRDDYNSDTLIIQYNDESVGNQVKSLVRSHKRPNAESIINRWVSIDIFVNITLQHPKSREEPNGFPWLRIVYECLDGNPNPGSRFNDGFIIRINKRFDGTDLEFDIINGKGAKQHD